MVKEILAALKGNAQTADDLFELGVAPHNSRHHFDRVLKQMLDDKQVIHDPETDIYSYRSPGSAWIEPEEVVVPKKTKKGA